MTTVYYCLPRPLSTSTTVYLLLGHLLGPLALLPGKTSIFYVMMCRSSLSHTVYWISA